MEAMNKKEIRKWLAKPQFRDKWIRALRRLRSGYRGDGLEECPLCVVGNEANVADSSEDYFLRSACDYCPWAYFEGVTCGRFYSRKVMELIDVPLLRLGLSDSRKTPTLNRQWVEFRSKQITYWIKRIKSWKYGG